MSDDPTDRDGPPTSETPEGLPHPVFNWMSLIGGGVAAMSATAMAFFFLVDLFTGTRSEYAGLLLLPPLLIGLGGFGFFVGGWMREVRRQRRGEHSSFFGRYVFDPWQIVRDTGPFLMLAGIAGLTVMLLSAGAGSVAVVEYSSSNGFCGEVCHAVMEPEYDAYEHAAHARVDCVKCHVAPGAGGFIAAKLGGLRQLWGVTLGEVTRPIPTPVHGPISRAQCETCHSSDRNIGYTAVSNQYFVNGAEDEPIQLAMVVKVGGGSTGLLEGSGIHYHMQVAEKVEYIARDPQRQEIAWVRVTDRDGQVREYENEAYGLDEQERASLPVRQMQCIDCHSRPAHPFPSPVASVNEALRGGKLPRDVVYLKEASVRALDGGYGSREEAMQGIAAALQAYYEEEDPDVLEEQSEELEAATGVLRSIYRRTIFPEMKADWRAHPDNLGHLESPGCFRCHSDEMVDAEGEPVFSDCVGCHAVVAQDDQAIATVADFDDGRGFVHPEDGGTFDEFTLCSDCHTGGKEVYE
jgi:hypothetical protein